MKRIWAALAALAAALAIAGCQGTTFEPTSGTFDNVETANGTADLQSTAHVYAGSYAGHFRYSGGGSNGYSRGVWTESWPGGSEILYGFEVYLPVGFYAAQQGQVVLARWDDYTNTQGNQTLRGGVAIYHDGTAHLIFVEENVVQRTIGTGFQIPEGQWTQVLVHQVLSATSPVNELSVNGTKQFSTSEQNFIAGRTVTKMRFGIVAIGAGQQINPIDDWLDTVFAGTA